MLQLQNPRPKSLTPLRPVLTANVNSPSRKRTPTSNKAFLTNFRYKKEKKDDIFKILIENAKAQSFLIEQHETEPFSDEMLRGRDMPSFYDGRIQDFSKNDNHFHSKQFFNVPVHVRNLSGDITFPSEALTIKPKVPKILKRLPGLNPSSPNQRLNTTSTNERYGTPEEIGDREPRFFTEVAFDERSYSPPATRYNETKTSKLTPSENSRYTTKAEQFHLRSGSIGQKTFIRKQVTMKKVWLDINANEPSNMIDLSNRTATKFQNTNKFNKPGPYRIKFFHEERERVAKEYANFYQIGDNLKRLERTNPIPIHIREYIHRLNNIG